MYDDQNVGPSDTERLSVWNPINPRLVKLAGSNNKLPARVLEVATSPKLFTFGAPT